MLIFEKFSGGIAPDRFPTLERGYGVPPQTLPPRGHIDCQVLRAPRYLNPALPMSEYKNARKQR